MKDLKRELCNYLIKNNMVKEYDVIKHSYTNARFNDWKTRNVESNNISPTLDTRCDCLGVVVMDTKVIGGIGKKKSNNGTQWYQQDRIYQGDESISITTTCNPYYVVGDDMSYVSKRYKEFITEHGYVPDMYNPYNNVEIKENAKTLTTGCGSTTSSATVLIKEEVNMEKDINVIGNYSPSGHSASKVVDSSGIAPTVMENHGTITATMVKENNKNAKHQQDLLQTDDGTCRTIPAGTHASTPHLLKTIVNEKNNLRIRKLTPKECFRLMGVKDEDSEHLEHLSNATKYHLAGDSIVVNVLQAIFKSILIDYPIVDQKPIRLIELFAGYGSQALALKYLGVDFEHWKICEWAIHSIDAYKSIHFPNNNEDYTEIWDKEDLVEYLYNKGISSNWNEPMKESSIKRKSEQDLRKIFNNCKATNNLINIQQVHAEDLEIKERESYITI